MRCRDHLATDSEWTPKKAPQTSAFERLPFGRLLVPSLWVDTAATAGKSLKVELVD